MTENENVNLEKVGKGTQGLITFVESDQKFKIALADDNSRRLLTTTLNTFVGVDVKFGDGMRAMGKICYEFLQRDEALQREAIKALCEAQGVPVIEEVGRVGLVRALFAKYPEYLKYNRKGSKNRDTLGSLRVNSYIEAYKYSERKGKGKHRGSSSGDSIRSAKGLWEQLISEATAEELNILHLIAGRCRIEYDKWEPKEEEVTGKVRKHSAKKK